MTWRSRIAILSVTVLASTGTALVASAPADAVPACQRATGSVISGTAGNDVIVGTDLDDTIFGLGGNDKIFGMGGNDTVYGGGGDDALFGGDCADLLMGGTGDDVLTGEDGDDHVAGDGGDDVAYVGPGNNHCVVEQLAPAVPVFYAYEYFGPVSGGEYWGPDCNEPA
jgi:Ca2+-binding RTX toxin-like protein